MGQAEKRRAPRFHTTLHALCAALDAKCARRRVPLQVTPVSGAQEAATAGLVLLALLILVPAAPDAPELAASLQAALQNQILQGAVDAGALKV